MVFYAPTINSYKRFVDASWAPTRLAWSYDNRTAGFRVVGEDQCLRIECRIPGADCNPYLAFAASLASGSTASATASSRPSASSATSTPPDIFRACPTRLRRPTDAFARSEFARGAFGDEVVEHYAHFFRDRRVRLQDGGHRLGTAAVFRTDLRPMAEPAVRTRTRGQRRLEGKSR